MNLKTVLIPMVAVSFLCCSCSDTGITSGTSDSKSQTTLDANAPVFTGLTKQGSSKDKARTLFAPNTGTNPDTAFIDEPVVLTAHFYNPDSFEILSFSINETKFSSYMFLPGSNMAEISVSVPGSSEPGDFTYVISQIKYVDGTNIKDVKMSGSDKYTVHFIDPKEEALKELKVYCPTSKIGEVMKTEIGKLLESFETDISVEIINTNTYDAVRSALLTDAVHGNTPSAIAFCYPDAIDALSSGLYRSVDLVSLCGQDVFEDYNEPLMDLWNTDGKQNAIPMHWGTTIGLANGGVLEDAYGDFTAVKIGEFNNYGNLLSEVNDTLFSTYGNYALGIGDAVSLVGDYCVANEIDLPEESNEKNVLIVKDALTGLAPYFKNPFAVKDFDGAYPDEHYRRGEMPLMVTTTSGLNYSLSASFASSYFIPSFGEAKIIQTVGAAYLHDASIDKNFDEVDALVKAIFESVITKEETIASCCSGGNLPAKDNMMADLTGFSQNYDPLLLPALDFVIDSDVLSNCVCDYQTDLLAKKQQALVSSLFGLVRSGMSIEESVSMYFSYLTQA